MFAHAYTRNLTKFVSFWTIQGLLTEDQFNFQNMGNTIDNTKIYNNHSENDDERKLNSHREKKDERKWNSQRKEYKK